MILAWQKNSKVILTFFISKQNKNMFLLSECAADTYMTQEGEANICKACPLGSSTGTDPGATDISHCGKYKYSELQGRRQNIFKFQIIIYVPCLVPDFTLNFEIITCHVNVLQFVKWKAVN